MPGPFSRLHRAPRLRPGAGPAILPGVVALILATAACDTIFGPTEDLPMKVEPITGLPRSLSAAESRTIRASNAFGFDLLREVTREDPAESVFLSPLSASMALGMTLNGAGGETFQAMHSTLRFGSLSEEEINVSYRDLLALLDGLDPRVELAVGNAIWHREGIPLREDFRERVQEHFDARVQELDFDAPGAADTVNAWVRGATNGRIDDIVPNPIPGTHIAYLLNAIYFHADWTVPFDTKETREAPFHLLDGTTAPVLLMMRQDSLGFAWTERYDAVEIPYGGGAYAMTVVVPREGTTVHELVEELDAEAWTELTGQLRDVPVQLFLPRFELEWGAELEDALTAMGMGIAFDGGADFSRMFERESAYIEDVIQKTYVRVDEVGTEAAAATLVIMARSGVPEVRADRPFLVAIRERLSGTILFLGVIMEPPTG